MNKENGALKQKVFYISRADWKKLIDYARAADQKYSSEISGMMVMMPQDDGTYLMSDPTILPQTISSGRTEIKKEALASYYMAKHQELGDGLRFVWWHSHCNMKAFMSGTDEDTMLEGEDDDWTVSLVVNVREEYELRINWFSPAHVYSKIILCISEDRGGDDIPEELIKEVERTVKTNYFGTGKYKKFENQKRLPSHDNESYRDYLERSGQQEPGWNPKTANEGELVCDFLTSCSSFMDGLIKTYQKGKISYKDLYKEFKDLNVYSEIFGIYIMMPAKEEIFKDRLLKFDLKTDRNISSMFYFDELSEADDAAAPQERLRGI